MGSMGQGLGYIWVRIRIERTTTKLAKVTDAEILQSQAYPCRWISRTNRLSKGSSGNTIFTYVLQLPYI